MKVLYLPTVGKEVNDLNGSDRARLYRIIEYFEKYGFVIGPKYVKKVSRLGIWELRAGKIRLFVFIDGELAVGVHIVRKSSQKLNPKDIKLAEKRSKEI